jgi:hypothetical protein
MEFEAELPFQKKSSTDYPAQPDKSSPYDPVLSL